MSWYKKFLDYSRSYKEVDGVPEDIFLNVLNYDKAFEYGIKYPDVKTAISFSYEIPLKGKKLEKEKRFHFYNKNNHFGWHGNKFINSKNTFVDYIEVQLIFVITFITFCYKKGI